MKLFNGFIPELEFDKYNKKIYKEHKLLQLLLSSYLHTVNVLPKQNGNQWQTNRCRSIGCSEIHLSQGTLNQVKTLIKNKTGCGVPLNYLSSINWGNHYEDDTRRFTEQMFNCKIYTPSGSIPSNNNRSCSPDGLGIVIVPKEFCKEIYNPKHIQLYDHSKIQNNNTIINLETFQKYYIHHHTNNEYKPLICLFEFKSPWSRQLSNKVKPEYTKQVLGGLDIIGITSLGIFSECVFRSCILSDLSFTTTYNTDIHNKDDGIYNDITPYMIGMKLYMIGENYIENYIANCNKARYKKSTQYYDEELGQINTHEEYVDIISDYIDRYTNSNEILYKSNMIDFGTDIEYLNLFKYISTRNNDYELIDLPFIYFNDILNKYVCISDEFIKTINKKYIKNYELYENNPTKLYILDNINILETLTHELSMINENIIQLENIAKKINKKINFYYDFIFDNPEIMKHKIYNEYLTESELAEEYQQIQITYLKIIKILNNSLILQLPQIYKIDKYMKQNEDNSIKFTNSCINNIFGYNGWKLFDYNFVKIPKLPDYFNEKNLTRNKDIIDIITHINANYNEESKKKEVIDKIQIKNNKISFNLS